MATLCITYESVIPFSKSPIQNQKNHHLELDRWVTLHGVHQIIPEIISKTKCSKFPKIQPCLHQLFDKMFWRELVPVLDFWWRLSWVSKPWWIPRPWLLYKLMQGTFSPKNILLHVGRVTVTTHRFPKLATPKSSSMYTRYSLKVESESSAYFHERSKDKRSKLKEIQAWISGSTFADHDCA